MDATRAVLADTRREVRKNTGDQTGRDGKCDEEPCFISCLKSDGPYRRSLFEVFVWLDLARHRASGHLARCVIHRRYRSRSGEFL